MVNESKMGRGQPTVAHSVRTAVVAVASLLIARQFRLPESYCPPITTLVIAQSSLEPGFGRTRWC